MGLAGVSASIDPARLIHETVGCAVRADGLNGAHGALYGLCFIPVKFVHTPPVRKASVVFMLAFIAPNKKTA